MIVMIFFVEIKILNVDNSPDDILDAVKNVFKYRSSLFK